MDKVRDRDRDREQKAGLRQSGQYSDQLDTQVNGGQTSSPGQTAGVAGGSGGMGNKGSAQDGDNNISNSNDRYKSDNDVNGVESGPQQEDGYTRGHDNAGMSNGQATHLGDADKERDFGETRDTFKHNDRDGYGQGAIQDSYPSSSHRSPRKGQVDKQPSVRRRHYDHMSMDDALQAKISTQLRENGIAETRVPMLSAKIAQAVRDDVMDASQNTPPQVTQLLREAIHKHLDPLLYNKSHVTDLSNVTRPGDASHLAQMVIIRLGQVHEEADSCRHSVDEAAKIKPKGAHTPREDTDRSILVHIKEGVDHIKTESGIQQEKLQKALKDLEDSEADRERQQRELEDLGAENWQLATDLKEAERVRDNLQVKVREQHLHIERLEKTCADLRGECANLRKQLEEYENGRRALSTDLNKLQSDKARLQVLLDQKEKEILRLRDPDKEMVHNMRLLQDEVTLLRTQTRRLNEEKGMLKSKSQRMESSLDETYKARSKLTAERDGLLKENQELRQRYRKVAGMVSTPQTSMSMSTSSMSSRALPDIPAGRVLNGGLVSPSSRATSRTTSRAFRGRDMNSRLGADDNRRQ